jgi:hypothetical protein
LPAHLDPTTRRRKAAPPMPKLPPRFNAIALPIVLTFLMTNVVSGVSIWRAVGFASYFIELWMSAWMLSWIVSFPVALFILPLSRRIVAALVEPAGLRGYSGGNGSKRACGSKAEARRAAASRA